MPPKGGKKPQYRAKHTLRRTRPIAPLVAAAAITVTVVGAAVGLANATPGTTKVGDLEPTTQPAKRDTSQPVSRSQTQPSVRPSPRPSSSAGAEAKKVRTAYKTWKMDTRVRVTNPRNGKSAIVRIKDRGAHPSGQCHDRSQED